MIRQTLYVMTFTGLWSAVARILDREHGWRPVLYAGLDTPEARGPDGAFRDVPFLDVADARRGRTPDHLAHVPDRAVDPALLHALAPAEAVIFEGMTRFLAPQEAGTVAQRRSLYEDMVRCWEGLLRRFQVEIVVAASQPHRVFDHVLQLVCHHHRIPFLALDVTSLPHLAFASTVAGDQTWPFREALASLPADAAPRLPATREALERVRGSYSTGRPTFESRAGFHTEAARARRRSLRGRLSRRIPQELTIAIQAAKLALRGQLTRPLPTLLRFHTRDGAVEARGWPAPACALDVIRRDLRTVRTVRAAAAWYRAHLEPVDWERPFLYFPANYMPERSTVPDAGLYHDYSLILDVLNATAPADWNIYFREHPRSLTWPVDGDNPRSVRFYERLRRVCPRLRFIGADVDPFRLIDGAQAVALATGTTGWEALARGTPVLSFGDYWYQGCPGVWPVHAAGDAEAALAAIASGVRIADRAVGRYLAAVESLCDDLSFYYRDNTRARIAFAGTTVPAPEWTADDARRMAAELVRGRERYVWRFRPDGSRAGAASAPDHGGGAERLDPPVPVQ